MKPILKLIPIILFATFAFTFSSCTRNDSETNDKKDAEARNDAKFVRADEKDAQYVVDAYAAGMVEIQLSERVKNQLLTADAKNLAATMITEHTAMNDKMRVLASSKQISLPTDLTDGEKDDINDLAKKPGTDLDKAFVDKLVSDHEKAETLFENASDKATDPDIKAAFADGLPKIRMHLTMAKNAKDKIK